MSLPSVNTFIVSEKEIGLIWKASPKSNIRKWNLYGVKDLTIDLEDPVKGIDLSSFNLIRSGIPNRDTYNTPNSVYVNIKREDLGIEARDTYYFMITSVDKNGDESDPEVLNVHAVPYGDDRFVDETAPVNLQYKNLEFDLEATFDWDIDRMIFIDSILGRVAKMIRIQVIVENPDVDTAEIAVRFNSFTSDNVTISSSDKVPFILSRTEIMLKRIWFSKLDGTACKLRVYISG